MARPRRKFNGGAGAFTLNGNAITLTGSIGNNSTSLQTIALGMSLTAAGSRTLFMTTGGGNLALTGTIGGAGGFTLSGAGGTATFSGANTYTGNTSIGTATTLVINNDTALGSGTLVMGGNGLFNNASGASRTIANNFQLSGGSGTFLGTNSLSITGTTTLSGATTRTITTNGTAALTLGVVTGAPNFTKSGTGTLILSAANTYSGTTTITAGRVIISAASNLGDGSVTNAIALSGGTLESTSGTYSLGLNRAIALTSTSTIQTGTGQVTIDGVISGAGGLNFGTAGLVGANVILTNSNSFTGNISLLASNTAGAPVSGLTITNSGALGAGAKGFTTTGNGSANGGLHLQNNITLSNLISFTTSGLAIFNDAGTNAINGNFSLNTGNGNTIITSSSGALSLGGNFTPIATGRNLVLRGSGAITISGTIANGTGNNILLGVQRDQSGGGLLTLSGSNTYTAATTLVGGTLAISSDSNLGAAYTGGIQALTFTGTGTGQTNGTYALTIGAPDLPGGIQATGSYTVAGGVITSVTISNSGSGYSFAPTVSATAGVGSGTAGTVVATVPNLALTNATLQTNAGFTSSRSVRLGGTSGTFNTNGFNSTFSGVFTGTGGLVKSGSGALTLSGSNSYTGGNTIQSGTLVVGNANALGASTGSLAANGGVLDLNGISATVGTFSGSSGAVVTSASSATFTASSASNSIYGGSIGGAVSFTKAGSGQLTLSGSNSYTGGSTIQSGTLVVGHVNALGAATGSLAVNGGTLDLAGLSPTVGTLSGSSGGLITSASSATLTASSSANSTYGGAISGAIGLTKAGSGQLTLSGSNSYTGGNTIQSGTLLVSNSSALGASSSFLAVNGGSLDLAGFSATVGTLSGSSGGVIASVGAATLTTTSTANSTYGGVFTGAVGLTKGGSGLLALTGSSANTGLTTVSGGTLAVNGVLGSGSVSVAAAAWLQGTGTIGGPVNVVGTLSPGNSPGLLTVGSVVLGGSSTTLIEINGLTRGSQYDGVNITGTSSSLTYGGLLSLNFGSLSPDNTTYDIFNFAGGYLGNYTTVTSTGAYEGTWTNLGGSGTFQFVQGNQTLTFSPSTGDIIVVPEPAAVALAGVGLVAAGFLSRRRRREAAADRG